MSLYKGNTLIAGGSQQTPLLSFVWADHLLSDISWLRADTFSWQAGSVYTAVYSHLTTDISGKSLQSETIGGTTIQFYLADDGHKICPANQESNVSAIYSATGVAWYYILDTVNTRFKLPRSKHEKYGNRPVIGNGIALGFTNGSQNGVLTSFNSHYETLVGSGYGSPVGTGITTDYLNTYVAYGITTDKTKSGIISTPVQDTDQYKYLYFYVGQFTQTAISQTAGLNAELFNGKADINTVVLKGHEVIEFQAPTADNNYTWYRKYADGWCEFGFQKTWNGAWNTTSLPLTMADTNYTITAGGYRTDSSPYQGFANFRNYTTTTVDIWFSDDTTSNPAAIRVYGCGFAA